MVVSMYLPKLAYLFLSWTQPANFLLTCGAVATEQFGYGFGFTALMLYMLLFADGPHKTAHFAICTGFMALGMMVPGHVERLGGGHGRLQALLRLADLLGGAGLHARAGAEPED